MPPEIFDYAGPLNSRTIFHRSADQADQTVATILGVIFGVIGFIILLCLFTCCCGACRVRSIPVEDIEKSSDGYCNGEALVREKRLCRSPKSKGQAWRKVETRREEVRERVVGGRGVNGINRPAMAHLGGPRPMMFHSAPPNLQALPPRQHLDPLQPREVRGGPRRPSLRTASPAVPRVGVPVVPSLATNVVPDLRFPISEGGSSDSESIGTGPTMAPPIRGRSPALGAPIEPSMGPSTARPPRTIIQPMAVHPRNVVTRPEFEDAIDDFENLMSRQLEGMRTKIEREVDEERRQRQLETLESNALQNEIINELDEEREKHHLEALGSNLRQQVMREDIAELRERTTNLEYESRRTKDTLISIATHPKTPPPPVIINNKCAHRSSSRRGLNDDDSSGSGFGGAIRPIGPGPPGPPPSSVTSGDDYLPTHLGRTRFRSSPGTPPNLPSLRTPHDPSGGPSSGLGMMFPEGSLDEGSSGFRTPDSQPASPRITPRPHPIRRASIEYPMPPQARPQQEASIPPHSRQPPQSAFNQGSRRPPSRGPPPRPVFLRPREVYVPSDSPLGPEMEDLSSPKFRDMPPIGRHPVAPGHIPSMRRSRENMRAQNSSRYSLFSEGNGDRGNSRDQGQNQRGGGGRRRSSDGLGGLGLRDPLAGFGDPRGRNASITSNHVSFVPSDQFERYSAASQGFDDSSMDDSMTRVRTGRGLPTELQPQRPDTQRRNSFHFHDPPERFGNHARPSFLVDAASVDSYDTDRVRGTARRTPSTVTEPWVDGERERYLRNMQRMGGMEAIQSQDTSSDTNMGPERNREGSGGSGVDRDGRFRYDRY
ncbi:hypothetical protein TWF679_006516 [Orbilia oligospora]|uniref:Uncharacterized protein n=2 Tax=Orbilia oligospora TaxID=2813651 RepID=A0A8H8V9F3_ORBOL|nr:hypothetical protein TWF679_006516 [Orbilia oligospora]